MSKLLFLGLVSALAASAAGKSLPVPSYITPCSRNEPDLSACVTKRGKETIPHIIGGDKRYNIPVLDPLQITRFHVDQGVLGLNFTATNVEITGLRNVILDSVLWDAEKKMGVYKTTVPRMQLLSDYDIGGRILILPISGYGRCNFTLLDMKIQYKFEFEYQNRDGSDYIIPTKSDLTFTTSRLFAHLENLFNGNKLLGDQMNLFMNENWREMVTELGPVIGQAIGEVMRKILTNVFEQVDNDHAFPDVPV